MRRRTRPLLPALEFGVVFLLQAAVASCSGVRGVALPMISAATLGNGGSMYSTGSEPIRLVGPDGPVTLQVSALRGLRRHTPVKPLVEATYTIERWQNGWIPKERIELGAPAPELPPLDVTWHTASSHAVSAELDAGRDAVWVALEIDGVGEVALMHPYSNRVPYSLERFSECGVSYGYADGDRFRVVVYGRNGARVVSDWHGSSVHTGRDIPTWEPVDQRLPNGPRIVGRCGHLLLDEVDRRPVPEGESRYLRDDTGSWRSVTLGDGVVHVEDTTVAADVQGKPTHLYGDEAHWMLVVQERLRPTRYHVPGRGRGLPRDTRAESRTTVLRIEEGRLTEKRILHGDWPQVRRLPEGTVLLTGWKWSTSVRLRGPAPGSPPAAVGLPEGEVLTGGYLSVREPGGVMSPRQAIALNSVVQQDAGRVSLRTLVGGEEVVRSVRCAGSP